MKQLFKLLVGGMLLMAWPLMMTSCEGTLDDIFGEWSRPTQKTPDSTDSQKENPIAVTGVTLDQTTLSLVAGTAGQLTATVSPDDAADKTVTWASADETIASVDANGKVTAVADGQTTITVTTSDGAKTADCKVIVTKAKVNVTSIKLSQTKLDNYIIDDPVTLVATVGPDDATDKTVVWKSDNPTFASVSATGEVSFNYQGTAKITATATNGTPDDPSDDVSATCEVTVSIKYITMTTTVDSKDFTDREMWKADTKFAIAYFIDDVIRKPAEATVQSISGTVATLSAQVDSRIVNNSTASIIYPYDAADTAPGDILPGALRDQDGVNTPFLWTAKVSKGASSVSLTDMAVGNYACVLFKPEVDGEDVILKLTSLEIYKGETDDKSKLTTVTYTPPTDTKSLIYVTLPPVKLGRIEGTDVDGKKYEIENLGTTLIKGKYSDIHLNMIKK